MTKPKIALTLDGDQITFTSDQCPPNVVTPPFLAAFPKLNRDQLEADMQRSTRRQTNYAVDITMKGASAAQNEFRSWMDNLDNQLLDLVHKNPHVVGTAKMSKDQLMVMQRRAFREKSNPRNGRVYADAMTCRSPLDIDKAWGVPVVDVNNEPMTEPVEYNSIVRCMLQYHGPYVVRGSMFGNSWRLVSVQVVGHADSSVAEPPPFPPCTDDLEMPSAR